MALHDSGTRIGVLPLVFCLAVPGAAFAQQEACWQGKTAPQWAEALAAEDERVQWYAAYALGQLGPEAAVAVDPLVAVLAERRQHEYVRGNAAWALGRIGVASEPVVQVLIDTVDTQKHISVRRNCPRALGLLGPAAEAAVPALLPLLEDSDPTVRANAAVALWKIAGHEKAIPTLIDMLNRGEASAPIEATVALGRLGAEPAVVVPALLGAFRHVDRDVHRSAARAIGQIGPAALASLKQPLSDADPEVCRTAVEALGWIGPRAVPGLIYALRNNAPQARRAAARALARLGPVARSAEAALIQAVNDSDRDVRQAAAAALKEIRGTQNTEPLPESP